jgi:hypothetical protein
MPQLVRPFQLPFKFADQIRLTYRLARFGHVVKVCSRDTERVLVSGQAFEDHGEQHLQRLDVHLCDLVLNVVVRQHEVVALVVHDVWIVVRHQLDFLIKFLGFVFCLHLF